MMGKQVSIYLDDEQAHRLNKVAYEHFRRPNDHAKYLLLSALGLLDPSIDQPANNSTATPIAEIEHDRVA